MTREAAYIEYSYGRMSYEELSDFLKRHKKEEKNP